MTFEYRAPAPEDAEALAELFIETFRDTFGHLYNPEDLASFLEEVTPERFRNEIGDERFEFVLANEAGKLAGFVKLGPPELPVETPPDTIELCQLYVRKEWHGTGVAAELMERALAAAERRGARHMQLSVYVDNHRARRFYERYGFEAVGRYDFMVGNHADDDLVLRHVILRADS